MEETIGQQLTRARESSGLTIPKVVQATHIRARHIEAMEADDFEALPSPVQARAFLRLYADFLGLSLDDLISRQRETVNGQTSGSSEVVLEPITAEESEPAIAPEEEEQAEELQTIVTEETGEETNEVPSEPTHSQIIFSTIGETLRERRESLSLTIEEIERHIHVRQHYLEALEGGAFNRLPSSVQARGMLNNYAHFLNLDVDALLLQFAEGLQVRRLERQPKIIEPQPRSAGKFPFKFRFPFKINLPASIRRYTSVDILASGGMIIFLLALSIWGTASIIKLRAGSAPQPTAPSISDVLLASTQVGQFTATPSPTSTGQPGGLVAPGNTTFISTLPAGGNGPVSVIVVALEPAWVRVTVDFKKAFEGRVAAGDAYPYDGDTQIEVLTGDGSAISIFYNGGDLGPMGTYGEVVDHIYTVNAILNPTATFTPSPTITLTPTRTLRPSITPRPSTTPRPSATPRISPTPNQ
jgi:cytoskeletal protein RodZ